MTTATTATPEHPSKKLKIESDSESKNRFYIDERSYGIQEYITPDIPGFNGVLKQRYSDFLVNEIDTRGIVIHLTTLTAIDEVEKDENLHAEVSESDLHSKWCSFYGEEFAQKIAAMMNDKNGSVVTPAVTDKEERKMIHEFVKKFYADTLTSTTNKDNEIVITYGKTKNRFTAPPKKFCLFHLYKENKDTMEAINVIAKLARINNRFFAYCGTKDKRGITVQQVTVANTLISKLQCLNSRLRGIRLGNFKYVDDNVYLGNLAGNRFSIVLRNVEVENIDLVEKALASLKFKGFINYFGMQRFGTGSVATHEIGKAILKNDWEAVVNLMLSPRTGEVVEATEARNFWANGEKEKALELMPKWFSTERTVMGALIRNSDDYAGAFSLIPRNMRLMYLHAYQSFIWNHAVSERIRRHGLVVVPGDLISSTETVHVINEDEVSNYSIFDVVLPLPGHGITLPSNSIGKFYAEKLQEDQLSLPDFKHRNSDFSLKGAYRNIVAKPRDLEWMMLKYDDPTIPLIQTDLDKLENKTPVETDGKLTALKLEFSLDSSQYATMALRELMKCETSSAYQSSLNQ